ncbi:N-acetyltransferase family protein [Cohnella lupini]|uniref:GNAT family N-acetyltransferase n=1 Tax=Cohnella lupini TaxID=1294267 RepID=UPI003CCC7BF7
MASHADTQQIREVAFETWTAAYRESLSIDFINNYLNKAFSISKIRQLIDGDIVLGKSSFLVAEESNQIIGYAQLIQLSEAKYDLYRIYIKPGSQKQGIGTKFLSEFIKIMKSEDALTVTVKKDNVIGRAFYSKNGFKEVEESTLTLEGKQLAIIKYELIIK